MTAPGRIDVDAFLRTVDLVELIERDVKLRAVGAGEYVGLCPFHEERSPSFTVSANKGFVHCFGCGAHHNAIGYVMDRKGLSFVEACEYLGAERDAPALLSAAKRVIERQPQGTVWVPLMPVPDDVPAIVVGAKIEVWNAKKNAVWRMRPTRADAYRDADGRLLGYVVRIEKTDGGKITPQLTYCIGPRGEMRWVVRPFPAPRPLCGLDDLARRPQASVIIVSGEKCRAACAGALTPYVAVTWAGGDQGLRKTDWSPLAKRDVILWPDADDSCRKAMLGYEDRAGLLHAGVAQLVKRAGCRSLRLIDPGAMPKGWDVADAIYVDGWSPRQIAAWAASRIVEIDVIVDPQRRAA